MAPPKYAIDSIHKLLLRVRAEPGRQSFLVHFDRKMNSLAMVVLNKVFPSPSTPPFHALLSLPTQDIPNCG